MRIALNPAALRSFRSDSVSSRVMTRPRAPNSWRFMPWKTTRFPLTFIKPSSIAKLRMPTFWGMYSVTVPSGEATSMCRR